MAKRRENGAGTFRSKGDKWTYQLSYLDDESHKVRLKSFTAETQEECLIRAEKFMIEQMASGEDQVKPTIADIMKEKYESDFAMNYTAEQGYTRNMDLLKLFNKYPLSKVPIEEITKEQIGFFLKSITYSSDSVISKQYGLINRAFKIAVERGLINKNPMDARDIRKPKSKKKRRNTSAFDIDEQQLFLKTLESYKLKYAKNDYRAQLLIELYSGMRMGEINALRPEDIDFDAGVIHVSRTVAIGQKSGIFISDTPKTANGIRTVPISSQLRDVLDEAIANMKANKENLIFYSHLADSPIRTSSVNKYFRRILEEAGLPARGQHSLRHTFATRCIESGISAVVLKEWLGHSDIHITLDVYADVFSSMENASMDIFDSYIDELYETGEKDE